MKYYSLKLKGVGSINIFRCFNELNYFGSKLIFSSEEKNLVASEEVLTTGSSPCPLIETVVCPDKYSDTITRYKTHYVCVWVQQVGAVNKLQDLTFQ